MSSYHVHALAHVLDRALGRELDHDLADTRAIERALRLDDGGRSGYSCLD